ncbi:MAG: hypothetical protein IRZ21_09750 [Thermoleophilaceae bacterium]|nr:hypothetical protein [Thermoleophilaceae bacterium]
MSLVDHDRGVDPEDASMQRARADPEAVAAEQQTRSELVDGRDHDRNRRRVERVAQVDRRLVVEPAAPEDSPRGCSSAEVAQRIGDAGHVG